MQAIRDFLLKSVCSQHRSAFTEVRRSLMCFHFYPWYGCLAVGRDIHCQEHDTLVITGAWGGKKYWPGGTRADAESTACHRSQNVRMAIYVSYFLKRMFVSFRLTLLSNCMTVVPNHTAIHYSSHPLCNES